jgi:hypothetical protein
MARLGKVSCDMAAARAADTMTAFHLLLLGEDQLIYCLRRLGLTLEAFTAMEERQARLRTRVETVTRMYEYSGRHHTYVTNILLRRESAFLEYRICNYSEIYDAKPELQIDVEYDMPIFASQCRDLLHGQAVLNGRRSTECADTTITLAHAMIEATEYLSGQLAQECAEYEEHEDLASYVKDLARTWTAGSADVATLLRCVCGARTVCVAQLAAFNRQVFALTLARCVSIPSLCSEAIEIYSEVEGRDHELTIDVIHKCAHLCDYFGMWKTRDGFNSDMLSRLKRSLGEQHPTTLTHALAISSARVPPGQHDPLVDPVQMRKAVYEDVRRRFGPDRSETREAAGLYVSDLVRAGEYSTAVSVSLTKLEGDRAASQSNSEIYNLFGTGRFMSFGGVGIAWAIFGLLKAGKMDEAQQAIAATLQMAEPFMMPPAVFEAPSRPQRDTATSFSRFVAIFVHFGLQNAVESERIYRLCCGPWAVVAHSSALLRDLLKGGLAIALFQQRDKDPKKKLEAVRLFRTIKHGHRRGWCSYRHVLDVWFHQTDHRGLPLNVLWSNSMEYTELVTISLNELTQELEQHDAAVVSLLQQLNDSGRRVCPP